MNCPDVASAAILKKTADSERKIEARARNVRRAVAITRIFRVHIVGDLRQEFEEDFSSVSVNAVNEAPGFTSVSILKPAKWAPDEYAMISQWENESALEAFAGKQWNHAVIPPGMEKFVVECWVHHYDSWTKA